MDTIYMIMTYLPVISGVVGVLAILAYVYQIIRKKPKYNSCLIIGCIGIGICLLIICGLFFAGVLGIGPTPT